MKLKTDKILFLIFVFIAVTCMAILISIGDKYLSTLDFTALSFTFLIIVLGYFFCRSSIGDYQTIITPSVLMTIAWIPILILHNLQLSPAYLEKLDVQTWLTISYSYIVFCFASLLASRSGRRRIGINLQLTRLVNNIISYRISNAIYFFWIVGLVAYFYNAMVRGGLFSLPIFNGVESKWTYLLPVSGQVILLMDVAAIWSFLCVAVQGFRKPVDKILIILITLTLDFFLYFRSNMYAVILIGAGLFLLINGKKIFSWRRLLLVSLVMLLVFQAVLILSGEDIRSKDLVDAGKITVPHYMLSYPYIYLTSSITNLQLNMRFGENTGGVRTFGSILSILQLIDIDSAPNYISYWGGGIVPYQGTLFLDYGYWGIVIGPIILGGIAGFVFKRFNESSSPLYAVIYTIIASSILTCGITNWFVLGRTWIFIISSVGFWVLSSMLKSNNRIRNMPKALPG